MDTSFMDCAFIQLSPFGAPATHGLLRQAFVILVKHSPCLHCVSIARCFIRHNYDVALASSVSFSNRETPQL